MKYWSFKQGSDYLICIVYILTLSLCRGGVWLCQLFGKQTLVVPTYIEVPGLNNLLVCPDLYFRTICEPGLHGRFWVLLFRQINMDPKWSPHAKIEVSGLINLLVLFWLLLQDHLWAWPPLMSWFMMSPLLYDKSFLCNQKS